MTVPTSLPAAVAAVARTHPRRPAVVTSDRALTYLDLLRQAERLAARLRGRLTLDAADAAEAAVAVTAAVTADVPLLVCDANSSEDERSRARSLFGADRVVTASDDLWMTVAWSPPDRPKAAQPPGSTSPTGPAGLGLSTSGSEGWPKCVQRSWTAVSANARAFADAMQIAPGETLACTTPPHHSYALCGGIVTALVAGATYVSLDRRSGPRTVADAIDRHRVAVLLSVPLLYRWYSGGMATTHRPRLCVSAGAPLRTEDRQRWESAVGWPIGEHYGTSEFGMLTLDTESVPGSVGRPITGVALRIDPSPGPGDVSVRTDGPPTRIHTGTPGDHAPATGGWQPTGDIGRLDPAGRLYLSGRRGATVNVAGNKVATVEVEEAVRAFPGVRDCAVVAAPGADGGQEVVAFVETGEGLDRRELYAFLRGRLAPYKLPSRVLTVDRLPRDRNGKLLRSQLLRGMDAGTRW